MDNTTFQKTDGTEALSKKERQAKRREEKENARMQQKRSRQMKKNLKWLILIIIVIGGIYWLVASTEKSQTERPGNSIPVIGRQHISAGDSHKGYNSNPPTSGAHAGPVNFGVYQNELPDENLIHNLEHGGVWISYKDLDENSIAILAAIADDNPRSVIMTPRSANDSPISVASWGRLMKLDAVDEELIREYIRLNTNKSPEPLAF